MEHDFWDKLNLNPHTASLDAFLQRNQRSPMAIQMAKDDPLSVLAVEGTRVAFIANIGSVLAYSDPPSPDTQGTVVLVRTANGDTTSVNNQVFVKFDDGKFLAMFPEHLRLAGVSTKVAKNFVRKVSSLGDLSDFLKCGGGEDNDLVHKATKDLWSLRKTDSGDYTISRLFDDKGDPLKV